MVRKKMEGDDRQRRKRAHQARKEHSSPSEEHVTTGASKQRHETRKRRKVGHIFRLKSKHAGKQQDISPDPQPGPGKK